MTPNMPLQEKNRSFLSRIPTWIRVLSVILVVLFLLLVAGWFILNRYIHNHKQQLLAHITEQISEHIQGNLNIADMEPALLHSFPDVSVRLRSVRLEDSLYPVHGLTTVRLESIYVRLNVFSLLSRHVQIKKITLDSGTVNLFTLANGYSNMYLLRPGKKQKKGKKESELYALGLTDVTFTYRHVPHSKEFRVSLSELDALIKPGRDSWDIHTSIRSYIHQLGFNLNKGGYLKQKTLEGTLNVQWLPEKKSLKIPAQTIWVNDIPIRLKAFFNFGKRPAAFDLDLNAGSINFTEGANMLSENISKKLNKITVAKNISVHAVLKGTFQYPDTPFVHIYIGVQNNTVTTPYGIFKNASFTPEFDNHIIPGRGRSDDNSGILIRHFTGSWYGIPLTADSTLIYGLRHPLLKTYMQGRFPVERLNNLVGNSFELRQGQAEFQLAYKGPVTPRDTFQRSLNGFFTIKDAGITYLPRNLKFRRGNATLIFRGEDLILQNVTLSSPNSSLTINGTGKRFLNAYFRDPSKAFFNWSVTSDLIDLNEFKSFLSPRRQYTLSEKKKNQKIRKFNRQLDNVLAKSTMKLDVKIRKVVYRRFSASDIRADIVLQENDVQLSDVRLNHAGGDLTASGSIHQQQSGNPFNLTGKINQVKVDQLFYAFENFGQDALDSGNIEGSFSADFSIKGGLRENSALIPNSLAGKVRFTLENGELNNFPPFLSISKFIFRKRNLDHITFKTLSDDLEIAHGKIIIHPLEIRSSAIHMEVAGIYGLDHGTDIRIKIPLRNPEKDRKRALEGLKPKKNKGIILYLRAKEGADGKVHIGWDPLQSRKEYDTIPTPEDL